MMVGQAHLLDELISLVSAVTVPFSHLLLPGTLLKCLEAQAVPSATCTISFAANDLHIPAWRRTWALRWNEWQTTSLKPGTHL